MTNDTNSHGSEWEALIDADPATTLYVDLAEVRNKVVTDTTPVTNVVPLTRRTWFKPAAAAAGVALLLGTGSGYTIAAMNESETMPAVYSGSISGAPAEVPAPQPGVANSAKDSAQTLGGLSKYSSIWPGYGGRPYLEPTSQLTDDAGKSVGYQLDASGVKRKTAIKNIADVFGVKGKVSGTVKDGLTIGDQTWAGPVVQFNGSTYDKQAAWNFSDQSAAPQMCGDDKNGFVIGTPGECKKPHGVAPTSEQAIAHAQELFGKIGLAADAAEWSTFDFTNSWGIRSTEPSGYLTVIADVLVGGKPSGMQWQMNVGPDLSVSSASGFLATFKPTAEYDIVGAKTAVLRSQDAHWINLGPQEQYKNGGYPMPLAYAKDSLALQGTVASGDGAMPAPSAPVIPSQPVDSNGLPILDAGLDPQSITSTSPAFMQWWLVDGSTILLPAYRMVADQGTSSVDDDRTWIQMSIADKYVDFN